MSGRRLNYLQEMGLGPVWRLRTAADAQVDAEVPTPAPEGLAPDRVTSPAPPAPASWHVQQPAASAPAPRPATAGGGVVAAMGWDELRQAVANCRACRLCEQRKQAVLGVGDTAADWMFVGEGPGAEEDERGEPFVGQAGRLLDNMLAAIGLRRGSDVYIANTVKCRPPGNRTPQPDELAACLPFLERQIALVQPRLLVALGRPAAATLTGTDIKIGAARGKRFHYNGIPLLVTYHPAYLLRNQPDKAKAWQDLLYAVDTMAAVREAGPA